MRAPCSSISCVKLSSKNRPISPAPSLATVMQVAEQRIAERLGGGIALVLVLATARMITSSTAGSSSTFIFDGGSTAHSITAW